MLADGQVFGEKIIREFLEGIRAELIAYMDAEDRNASGKSKASLQVVNVTDNMGQLVGAQWIQYVFKGRPPGKMPPLSAIVDWCNARGIPRGYAWVIAQNIAELGTKLYQQKRNIFNEIITEAKIDTFVESFAAIYTARVKSGIASMFYSHYSNTDGITPD